MELKTLKDLQEFNFSVPAGMNPDKFILKIDLKQEAIKWIKELEKTMPDPMNSIIPEIAIRKKDYHQGTINWIKHFFNITEEDLK